MTRPHCQSTFLVLIALLHLPSYAIAAGPPTVLTFDDIATGDIVVPMPPGYGGVSWPNNVGVWGFSQAPYYLPQSPPNRVLFNRNSEFEVAENLVNFIGGPKIFDGAYFTGLSDVQFKLYSGATLVGTSSILSLVGGSNPVFLASGYAGPVDTVGIVCGRSSTAMDDFTFEQVPEPSALVLLSLCAISLLSYRKTKSYG